MNILIVAPKSGIEKDFRYMFPLGLAYISSVLKQAGHHVDCLQANHYEGTTESIIHSALKQQIHYDFVCSGGLSAHFLGVKIVVNAVRSFDPNIGIILGGGLVTSEPELIFNTLRPNFIVLGEGEKTIVDLLSCIASKADYSTLKGIGFCDSNGVFVCNGDPIAINDLDALPWPDFDGFEFHKYLNNMKPSDIYFYDIFDFPRVYPIISSRSCPFNCTFCFHPIGKKYRQRSIDSVIQELEVAVSKYTINLISIYDELFSHSKERVHEFCKKIQILRNNTPWELYWSCQLRVERLDEDMLKMMKDAGCHNISFGFESYSNIVLKSMEKHITPAQIDNAINISLNVGISLQGNFIFGDKAETFATANETLNYCKSKREAGILVGFVVPYPGTKLYMHCVKKGIIKDKLKFIENDMHSRLNITDSMSDAEFERLKIIVLSKFHENLVYSPKHSIKKIKDNVFSIKVKCPHCNQFSTYNNYEMTAKRFYKLMFYCRNCRKRFFVASKIFKYLTKLFLLIIPIMGTYWTKISSFVPGTTSFRQKKATKLLKQGALKDPHH